MNAVYNKYFVFLFEIKLLLCIQKYKYFLALGEIISLNSRKRMTYVELKESSRAHATKKKKKHPHVTLVGKTEGSRPISS